MASVKAKNPVRDHADVEVDIIQSQIFGPLQKLQIDLIQHRLLHQIFRSVDHKIEVGLVVFNPHIAVHDADFGPEIGVVLNQLELLDLTGFKPAKLSIQFLTQAEIVQRRRQGNA